MKILFGLTGSIACYKACELISALIKKDFEVQVIATPSALKFVGEATLEGLTGRAVLSDGFTRGRAMDHIELARWADLFIIAPLTAHHAALFAGGFAEDLLSTLFVAYETHKPLLLAPAMNTVMWQNPAVEKNFATLQARGVEICEPHSGRLACGEEGQGKMREPAELLELILRRFENQLAAAEKNILVTYGGTREIIDGVRTITNLSTGTTGARLCDELVRTGFKVTALSATGAMRPQCENSASFKRREFTSHADLNNALQTVLRETTFTHVIHLAAVSDYTVSRIDADGDTMTPSPMTKLSSQKEIVVTLKPTAKIVNLIKEYAHEPKPTVIAFKLTNGANDGERDVAVKKLLASIGVDIVVHNDVTEIDQRSGAHAFSLISKNEKPKLYSSRDDLARGLVQLVSQGVNNDSMS